MALALVALAQSGKGMCGISYYYDVPTLKCMRQTSVLNKSLPSGPRTICPLPLWTSMPYNLALPPSALHIHLTDRILCDPPRLVTQRRTPGISLDTVPSPEVLLISTRHAAPPLQTAHHPLCPGLASPEIGGRDRKVSL